MAENIDDKMDSSIVRKKRLKELLDIGGQIRITKDVEDNVLTVNKISNIIKETDLINKHGDVKDRASNTTEVVMDAQVIQMGHELIGEVMQKTGNSQFSDEEWINTIIGLVYKNDNEDWSELSKIATKIAKPCKYSPCLLGAFDLPQNEIQNTDKERQKRSKNSKGAELKPVNVSQVEKYDGNTESVKLIYRQIIHLFMENHRAPIPYYQLIIDPNNFMKTVDNSFKIAFLARDKSVAIESSDDDFPTIRPLNKQDKANDVKKTIQAISSINTTLFREMIQKYHITESMLN